MFRETTDLDTEQNDTLNRVVQEYRQRMRDARAAAPKPICLEDTANNRLQALLITVSVDDIDAPLRQGCQP